MRSQFDYVRAGNTDEAFSLLKRGAIPYQGGTDLLVQLRSGKKQAALLADISDLQELNGISLNEEMLSIGAACTAAEIAADPLVTQWAPGLAQGAALLGSPAIRNKATIGGNIGTASPAADMLTACWTLEAVLLLISATGERRLPLDRFIHAPGRHALQPTEFIARIEIPLKHWTRQHFFKVGRRNAMSVSVVNGLCAFQTADDGIISLARIGLGAVAPTPLRISEAEAYLSGKHPRDVDKNQLMELVRSGVQPISDVRASADYRRYIAGVMVKREMEALLEN